MGKIKEPEIVGTNDVPIKSIEPYVIITIKPDGGYKIDGTIPELALPMLFEIAGQDVRKKLLNRDYQK